MPFSVLEILTELAERSRPINYGAVHLREAYWANAYTRKLAASRAWKAANPVRAKASVDAFHARHPDAARQYARSYRKRNPEKLRARKAAYAARPEVKEREHLRYLARRAAK